MKIKKITFMLLCFISVYVKAQEDHGSYIPLKLSSEDKNETYFHVYKPPFKAKVVYKDFI